MAKQLPVRADLAFLKKLCKARVKAGRAAGETVRLAEVQRAVAREYGEKSWGALTRAVAARRAGAEVALTLGEREAFIEAALPESTDHRAGDATRALEMLARNPGLATADVVAACVTGSVEALRGFLAADRKQAISAAGPRSWRPLSYLCFSRLLRFETSARKRAEFLACARMLLEAGADANTSFVNVGDNMRESALYGAATLACDPGITKLLLDAGAKVDDGESLYHAAESKDHACLELLLAAAPVEARAAVSYAMCHNMDMEDPAGVALFLKYGADPNYLIEGGMIRGFRPLHFAIVRNRSVKVIGALLKGGADPQLPAADGTRAPALARRLGRKAVVAALEAEGAQLDMSPREAFLAACSAGDRKGVRAVLGATPALISEMRPEDHALLVRAAGEGRLAAVRLMLEVGFPIDAAGGIGDWGGTALHHAAWGGHLPVVKLLLKKGASTATRQHWGGDVLSTAIHGATHGGHPHGLAMVKLVCAAMGERAWGSYVAFAEEKGNAEVVAYLKGKAEGPAADPFVAALPAHRRGHKIVQWKPLMDAAFAGDVARIRKLLAGGADPNVVSTTPQRYRPLHRAVESKKTAARGAKHEGAVRALLEGGADPQLRGGWEQLTALGMAAVGEVRFVPLLRGRFEPLDIFHASALAEEGRVRELLRKEKGLATAPDANRWTALQYAANSALFAVSPEHKARLLAIARLLLAAGAHHSAHYLYEEKWPIPVLYGACGRHDFPEMAELLITAGATACDGESVYHASDEGHVGALAVIERLTEKGALAAECSKSLATQLHWGRTRGMAWLLAHGADPEGCPNRFGNCALHEAAMRGSAAEVIDTLLAHGADPRRTNKDGKTAVELARAAGKMRVVEQLEGAIERL